MLNFEYYNPTRILFGEGEISKLSKFIPANSKVLVLYGGGSIKKTGTLDEVLAQLKDFEVDTFSGIEANPEYDTLMKAVEKVRKEGFTYLLAVGGGSVIDGVKFISAAVSYPNDPWEILLTDGNLVKEAVPFGCVLTIAATGSEMNFGSVITRRSIPAKLSFHTEKVFPQFSILDPAKTLTLPDRQISNGIADSFVHVIEQYVTYPVNGKLQDRFAEGILSTLMEEAKEVFEDPENIEIRANLMWSATMALNSLINKGVPQDWSMHKIAHEFTALYGIDHAKTLAIVLPGVWHIRKGVKQAKLLQYGERVLGVTEGSIDERIEQIIQKTEEFFHSLGIKTRLPDYNIPEKDIDLIVNRLVEQGKVPMGEDKAMDAKMIKEILEDRL
ncbi:MAG: iron-containing alcohol dehydrogenase [Psittacicella sp.]